MGLVLNLIVQTIVWFGFMGVIIFSAAGTLNYAGGWLYLGEMVAISVVCGAHGARVDPGLLRERLKPPVQKDQPLADKLVLIPFLLLLFGAMGFMAADAARWHWSMMPHSVQWAGCGLLLAAFLFIYWTMRTNSFGGNFGASSRSWSATCNGSRTMRCICRSHWKGIPRRTCLAPPSHCGSRQHS